VSALPVPILQGEKCLLRALTVEDAPSLQRHADDEAVWRNLFEGFPRPYTLLDAELWCLTGSKAVAIGHVWGIEVAGQVAGCISIRPDSGWLRCNAEVGYWIGQAFWQRGITSEALGMVTQWAWKNLADLTRIYAPVFSWNTGSQAVANKCGFSKEGEFKRSAIKNDQIIDRTFWAQHRPEASPPPPQLPRTGPSIMTTL
jgi:RimJ/RimL family protein N-acetyltransferase